MNHVQQNTLHLYEMNAAVDFAVSDAPSVWHSFVIGNLWKFNVKRVHLNT